MPIDKLVPTANASTATALTTNDYTLINETVASANGSVNDSIVDDWAGATAAWTSLSTLTAAMGTVNSATFRVRARVVTTSGTDDDATYTFTCTVNGTPYTIVWTAASDRNAGFADRTQTVGTSFTSAQYEAATVSVAQSGYSKSKGFDNLYIDIDAFELEVNYNEAVGDVASFGGVAWGNISSINTITKLNMTSINGEPTT